jgi:uncharacterized membrane protein
MQILYLLWGTFLLRPYVFIFLIVYLSLSVPAWGWRRTGVYTLLGYAFAWLAEFSSIHNGFPFGPYSYISAPTLHKELWVAGVPFMDSLSFVFLTFAGLQTARLLIEPLTQGSRGGWDVRWANPGGRIGWRVWALGGLLTMGLDIVIDPVALRGSEWFLGQIYSYPPGGIYFDVPLANFAGWALVSWVITGVFLLLDRWLLRPRWGAWRGYPGDALVGSVLFAGVLLFNLLVTFAIGQVALGLLGCLLGLVMLGPIPFRLARLQLPEHQPTHPPVLPDEN